MHTEREIHQQPELWLDTARRLVAAAPDIGDARSLALTGSGSSEYAGACAVLPLRAELGIPVEAIPAGLVLTHGPLALQPGRPALLVSLARSGDSPESCAAVEILRKADPRIRHLAITCNANGRLARDGKRAGEAPVVLDDRTNDRSLVMTSSFTSMVLAARFLGYRNRPDAYLEMAENLSRAASCLLSEHDAALRAAAESGFHKAVYLGTGASAEVARETGLKMLEMNAGRISVVHESFLGLRHGPLAFIDDKTLIVGFLSSDPLIRAYELDVLAELARKQPASRRVVICGEPPAGGASGATILSCPGLEEAGDANAPIVFAVAGQLLALHRCVAEGLNPDAPSESGAINRVVTPFTIHQR